MKLKVTPVRFGLDLSRWRRRNLAPNLLQFMISVNSVRTLEIKIGVVFADLIRICGSEHVFISTIIKFLVT